MILKFELESFPRRPVDVPLVEHLADMGSERHETEKMLPEQALALLRPALREDAAGGGQFDRAALELGELEDVESAGDREQVVDFERRSLAISASSGMSAVRAAAPAFRAKPPIR